MMPSSDKEAKVSTAKMIGFDVSVTKETHSGNRESLDFLDDGLDPVYQAKARILNEAIHEIGMGKYQWFLFIVTGFGWFADNLWTNVPGLILLPVVSEFNFQGPFLKLSENIGLLIGALFWGLSCDIWGRRWPFNLTLLVIAVFSIASGGSTNILSLILLTALYSVGVGGNLPVDSAVFLEFIPGSHQYLLTMLTVWRAIGQLAGSLIAWPLIANFSCPSDAVICTRPENKGWRYYLFILGGIMFILWFIRFFVFTMYESPKYLMGRGRDEDAVKVVHAVASYNGKTSTLSIEHLQSIDSVKSGDSESEKRGESDGSMGTGRGETDMSATGTALRRLRKFDMAHVKALFATRKLAWNTSLLILLWSLIGLAFPLYDSFITVFLQTRGAVFGDGSLFITYRNQAIVSTVAVPAAFVAGWAVELPYIGRKGTLAISTGLTGIFLFASTTSRSDAALLGWNCGYSFTSTIMHGVLYAITPELFATKDRGTGNALTATANRIFGVLSPIVALAANITTTVPIWIAGSLLILSGFIALLLPQEPRGRASL